MKDLALVSKSLNLFEIGLFILLCRVTKDNLFTCYRPLKCRKSRIGKPHAIVFLKAKMQRKSKSKRDKMSQPWAGQIYSGSSVALGLAVHFFKRFLSG
jgi:hypothetical protein